MDASPSDTRDSINFDFITDEQFRASLQADYAELTAALGADAVKAALVLSGSIIEAVLVDYLVSTGQKKPDPLRMELADLIKACATAGVLTERTAELSSVIRSYRNLIHPGRVARLSETYAPEDAQVAAHVVRIIVREVARQQAKEFGLTAEQVVTKFERDHNAPAIADHLLGEMRQEDLRRLLLDVLPSTYFDYSESIWEDDDRADVLERFEHLYRAAFEASPDPLKKTAARRYAEVLRNEAGSRVEVYDEAFFRGPDLEFFTKADRGLVIAHLLGRLDKRATASTKLLQALPGLSRFLDEAQFQRYIDGFVRVITLGSPDDQRIARSAFANDYDHSTTFAQDEAIRARLGAWISFFEQRGNIDVASRLQEVSDDIPQFDDDDIPF